MDRLVYFIILALFLVAPAAQAAEDAFDRIAPGTKLNVTVFGYPEMTRELTVGATGAITLPLVGGIDAAGATPAALAGQITEKLNAGYIVNPQVTVEITSYPPVYVTGLAASPGAYPYAPGLTVRQAVALAGGFGARARTSSVRILRSGDELEAELDTPVLPGDTLDIGRRWF